MARCRAAIRSAGSASAAAASTVSIWPASRRRAPPSSRALALANAAQCRSGTPQASAADSGSFASTRRSTPSSHGWGPRGDDRATAASSPPTVPDATFRPFNLPPPMLALMARTVSIH